jgi:cysteine-rich repeat protein
MTRARHVGLLLAGALAVARLAQAQPARIDPPVDLASTPEGTVISDASIDGTGTAAFVWTDAAGQPGGGIAGFAGEDLEGQFSLANPPGLQGANIAIAGLPAGGFVTAWTAFFGNQSQVLTQCVGAGGVPIGSGTRQDDDTHLHPGRPTVAVSPGGRVLAVWEQDTVEPALLEARFLDTTCAATGGVFAIAPQAAGVPSQPDVAVDGAGRFLVAWRSTLPTGAGIEAVLLADDGTPLGPVNVLASRDVESPAVVAPDPRGGFLVAWVERTASEGVVVRARRLDPPALTPDASLTLAHVPLWSGGTVSLAFQADGTLLLGWRIGTAATARSFAPNGLPHDEAFRVSIPAEAARSPFVVAGPGSRFLVTWMSTREASATRESTLRAQVMSLCGNSILEADEACDDGNGRDDDCCSSTCEPLAFAGECWLLSRRSVLKATARDTIDGRSQRCRARCQIIDRVLLVLDTTGGYRIPGDLVTCADGTVTTFPDEQGFIDAKGQRFRTTPTNLDALDTAFRECSDSSVTQLDSRFRRLPSAVLLRGERRMALQPVGSVPGDTHIRTKLVGTRSDAGAFPEPPRRRRGLFECVFPLQLECR